MPKGYKLMHAEPMTTTTTTTTMALAATTTPHVAAYTGDTARLALHLHASPDLLHAKDDQGRTILHWAVAGAQTATVKYLIGRWHGECLLDVQDSMGDTPLHLCCGPFDVLQLLYRGGSVQPSQELKNKKGESASEASPVVAEALRSGVLLKPIKWNASSTSLFSFMRRSSARHPPATQRAAHWVPQVTRGTLRGTVAPFALAITLAVLPPIWSQLLLGLLLLYVCAEGELPQAIATQGICRLGADWFWVETRPALVVLFALIVLLGLQNVLFLQPHLAAAPFTASVHLLLQLITVVTYVFALTADPGFVPGGRDADHDAYWDAFEEEAHTWRAADGVEEKCAEEQEAEEEDAECGMGRGPLWQRLAAEFCPRSELRRLPRSKFSPCTNGMVKLLDHDCVFLGVCIGEGNHRAFLVFMTGACITIGTGVVLSLVLDAPPAAPSTLALDEDQLWRLHVLGVLLGVGVFWLLSQMTLYSWRNVLANILAVENLKYDRAQQAAGRDTSTLCSPQRSAAAWRVFAPYDTGSALRNLGAFCRATRGQSIATKRSRSIAPRARRV